MLRPTRVCGSRHPRWRCWLVRCAVRTTFFDARGRAVRTAAALAAAGLFAGCSVTYGAAHTYAPHYPHAGAHPTTAEQIATLHATEGYRRFLLTSAEGLSTALGRIARDAASGNLAAARRDELAGQADYDVLRPAVQVNSATEDQLDGEPWSVTAGSLSGLHAIERALWSTNSLVVARRDALAMGPAAVTSAFVFSREVLTPDVIVAQVQSSLAWAAEVPVEQRAELFSHRDLVDVRASALAAATALHLVEPLGLLVAPSQTARARAAVDDLLRQLDTTAQPVSRPDASIASSTWRTLAQDLDAANATLGVLGGEVSGFGSGRTYA